MIRENIIIIGNGPAGASAAVYAARAGLKPRMFAGSLPGGLIGTTDKVENYAGFPNGISGFDLVMAIQDQAEKFGAVTDYDEVTAVEFHSGGLHHLTSADGREFETPALIIATGAAPRPLNVPGEEKFRGRGVSACATCDGAFFKDVPVAVAGGGDSAMEEAIFLTRFASHVHLIHRRTELRASHIMAERARSNPRITFHLNSVIEEILGDSDVTAVRCRDVETGEITLVECKGVFAALGHQPATGIFQRSGLSVDPSGCILTQDRTTRTNIDGVFAAGDCADPRYRQAIIAAGSGACAAIDAEKYLENAAAK